MLLHPALLTGAHNNFLLAIYMALLHILLSRRFNTYTNYYLLYDADIVDHNVHFGSISGECLYHTVVHNAR